MTARGHPAVGPRPVQRTLPGDQVHQRGERQERHDDDVGGRLRGEPHPLKAAVHELRDDGQQEVAQPGQQGHDDGEPAEGDLPVGGRHRDRRHRGGASIGAPLPLARGAGLRRIGRPRDVRRPGPITTGSKRTIPESVIVGLPGSGSVVEAPPPSASANRKLTSNETYRDLNTIRETNRGRDGLEPVFRANSISGRALESATFAGQIPVDSAGKRTRASSALGDHQWRERLGQ